MDEASEELTAAVVELCLRLADDAVVAGLRMAEWRQERPELDEEDAGALDLPDQTEELVALARALYAHAGRLEGEGRDADDFLLAREPPEFRNALMAERPNGDFAHAVLRRFLIAAAAAPFWARAGYSEDPVIAALAGPAEEAAREELERAADWVARLGDGTETSEIALMEAAEALSDHVDELFEEDAVTEACEEAGVAPAPSDLRPEFERALADVCARAGIDWPAPEAPVSGGRQGVHGDALDQLVAGMQAAMRGRPDAAW